MKWIVFLILAVFLFGCAESSITQEQAEETAAQFVKSNVRFFATEHSSKVDLAQYTVESVSSYMEGKNWVVVMHISSQINGTEKKSDLEIRVNGKREIVEFNGKKLQ